MDTAQKKEMLDKVNNAVRWISDQDSTFGMYHLNLEDADSVRIKNAFTTVVNSGIYLLHLLQEYEDNEH